MFDSLAEKFDTLLRRLQGQGKITERNIEDALRDVRLALLEADVNLDVVRAFVDGVRAAALGTEGCFETETVVTVPGIVSVTGMRRFTTVLSPSGP